MKYLKLTLAIIVWAVSAGASSGENRNMAEPKMDKLPTAEQLIQALELEGHVEGGYFRRTFQADHRDKIATESGGRYTMTSIYYLLTADSRVGHWHVNKSDILHFFHLGSPITYYLITPKGELNTVTLGPDPTKGHRLQFVVKGGTWKASYLPDGDYGLISEAVSPGFEYSDMTLGDRDSLIKKFPQHRETMERFSKLP